ncbi:uncharacterized protein TNCV_491191 [Trichonephila clavipes]|nr:uncharacterized protein TNCV_491191 [Trichonephila clavipes]
MPPSPYGGNDPGLVTEWVRIPNKALNALESTGLIFISSHSNYFQFLYNICDLKDTPQNVELKYCKDLETVLTDGNSSDINALDLADEIVAVLNSNSVAQQPMRAGAYYAHPSICDHWTLRYMSRCLDQVVSLTRDPQCLSPQVSMVLIYRPTVVGMKG